MGETIFAKLGAKKMIIFDLLESLVRKIQMAYMAPRRTTEIVEAGRIRFHPQDARNWVLREYQKKLRKLNFSFEKRLFRNH